MHFPASLPAGLGAQGQPSLAAVQSSLIPPRHTGAVFFNDVVKIVFTGETAGTLCSVFLFLAKRRKFEKFYWREIIKEVKAATL